MRDKLLFAHARYCGSALSLIRRVSEGGQRARTILTRRPGLRGQPAAELRSLAQLPKVFMVGLSLSMDCGIKVPLSNLGGALMEQAMRGIKKALSVSRSNLSGFKTEIFQSGAAGLQTPQINGEEPGTGHDRFLAAGSPAPGL